MAEKECDCLCPRCVRLFSIVYWAEEWAAGRMDDDGLRSVVASVVAEFDAAREAFPAECIGKAVSE